MILWTVPSALEATYPLSVTENQYKNVLTAIDLVSSSLASRAEIPVSDDLDPVLDGLFDDESVPDSVVEGLVGLCVFLLHRLEARDPPSRAGGAGELGPPTQARSARALRLATASSTMTELHLADLIASLRELSDEELAARGYDVQGTFDEVDDPILIGPDGVPVETWREGYPYDSRMTRDEYEHTKRMLQIELLKAQTWLKETEQRLVVLFEGEAAGEGRHHQAVHRASNQPARRS